MIESDIYDEVIEIRELKTILDKIEQFKNDNIYVDTKSQAIRVLIRRGLMQSGYLNENGNEK